MTPSQQQIVCGTRRLTGADLRERAARLSSALEARGLVEGDVIVAMLRNEIEYLEIILAAAPLGLHLVPLNWHFRNEEARHILHDSGAKLLFAHADLLPRIAAALASMPASFTVVAVEPSAEVRRLFTHAEDGPLPPDLKPLAYDSFRDAHAPWRGTARTSSGAMLYTSGTTGLPKGVKRLPGTPAQIDGARRIRMQSSTVRPGMRVLQVMPLHHAGPMANIKVAMDIAELIVIQPRFDAVELLQAVPEHRITHLNLVPTMIVRLMKLPPEQRERFDLSSLESISHGAGPCPVDLKREFIDWVGPIVSEVYGSTEMGLITWSTSAEFLARPGTVGKPFIGSRFEVRAPDGRVLPPGEVGEIHANSGDNALPFVYAGRPASEALQPDGFFSNGDIGWLDADGFLYLTDRQRDIVVAGGVNIYPVEIEHALLGCPGVVDCAVFGIPDPEFGEAVAAAVLRAPGSTVDEAAVRAHLAARLASFKLPRVIEFHAELPRDAMGKVFKNKLREPFLAASRTERSG